jgi:transcription-repair coupling factor (superfamily II helicase)
MGVTIPSSYIPQEGVRISLYRRLLQVSDPGEVEDIKIEMADRFGPIPGVVQYLLDLCIARRLGGLSGIISISSDPVRTRISFTEGGQVFSIKSFPGWIFRNNEAVGPGGFKGMKSLVQMLETIRSNGERKKNSGGDHQGG